MSIEKITSKIMNDAEISVKTVLDQANEIKDEILAEASEKAAKIEEDAAKRGADEKEKLISRRKAVADIDGRKIILEEKQKLIAECFDKAVEKIVSMDKEKYVDFLVQVVKNTGMTDGELILNEKDSETVGNELIAKLSKEIPESRIVLSKETQKIKGGFLLKKGSVFMNGTIEALVEEAKEELIGEVAEKLFG